MFYDQLLPGMGSLIRRFAVPCMATPLVGALFSHLFALPRRAPGASRRQLPYLFYFLVFALSYGATLLAFFPGIINYDFEGEIAQYLTGEYLASHPIFHTVLTGVLYRLGTLVFGSATGGAATYSVFQLLCLSAMVGVVLLLFTKAQPFWATLLLTAAMAILPYNGVLAISTIKDTLFTGLCAMLCLTLWEIAESPEAFLSSKKNLARLFGICLTMSLLRHNAVFATLPALLVVILLCRNERKKAVAACAVTLLCCGRAALSAIRDPRQGTSQLRADERPLSAADAHGFPRNGFDRGRIRRNQRMVFRCDPPLSSQLCRPGEGRQLRSGTLQRASRSILSGRCI